jgi:hypothetical protein
LTENGLTEDIPELFPEEEVMRVLHARYWNYKLTHLDIVKKINWRLENLPIQLNDATVSLLKGGFASIFGRDNHHRPIVIFRPMVAVRLGLFDSAFILNAVCFCAFYCIKHMFCDGKVEN